MNEGYVSLHRRIWKSPHFDEEPLTQREAFMWMLCEAAWRPTPKRVAGKMITLRRGQFSHSERFMAEKWRWSKSKVRRFLCRLKNEDVIEPESGPGQLIITICNYDEYQSRDHENEPESGPGADQERTRSGPESGPESGPVHDSINNCSKTNKNTLNADIGPESGPAKKRPVNQNRTKEEEYNNIKDVNISNKLDIYPPEHGSGDTNDLEAAKDAWNEMASANGLTLVRKLSHQRQVKLKRRISDAGGLQQFCFLVQTIPKARFLVGDNRDGWKADFDFVLQESSFIKLLEGRYHNNVPHSDPIRGAAAILANEAGMAAEVGEFYNPAAWDD